MYFKPDKVNGPIVYSYKLLLDAEDAIYERISDITISMKAKDHLKMPELVRKWGGTTGKWRIYCKF